MIPNEHEINVTTAHTLFSRYWNENEERIREWVEDKIVNEYMNERIDFDLFMEEFPFKFDEKVTFGMMVDVYMDFLGQTVTALFIDGIERRFEHVVDEIMKRIELEEMEQEWQEQEYRRMVV